MPPTTLERRLGCALCTYIYISLSGFRENDTTPFEFTYPQGVVTPIRESRVDKVVGPL